jgi:hypothetical protein
MFWPGLNRRDWLPLEQESSANAERITELNAAAACLSSATCGFTVAVAAVVEVAVGLGCGVSVGVAVAGTVVTR